MLKKPNARFSMIALSLFSVLMLLLSACGATGTPATGGNGSGSNAGTPVKGGVWVDDIPNEPDSLLPNGGSQTFSTLVDQSIYLPLFVGDYNGNITPGAATVVPTVANGGVTSDFKTYTFHMKPGLKWSDGQPYNADDVDFTIKLWNNPKYGAANTLGYNLVTSTDVSSDKLSITFHLKQAFAPFVSVWTDGANSPMPKHHFASVDPASILKSADNLNPQIASGPFMMSESKPGDHYTVVRNPNYYLASQGLPYLDKIVYNVVADENTIYKNLQAGSITSSWFLDVSKTNQYKQLANYVGQGETRVSTHPRFEPRLSALERRQLDTDTRIEEMYYELTTSIKQLSNDMEASFKQLSEYLGRVEVANEERFQKIETRLDKMDARFNNVEALLVQVLERLPKSS